jgi:hypothetical protein
VGNLGKELYLLHPKQKRAGDILLIAHTYGLKNSEALTVFF